MRPLLAAMNRPDGRMRPRMRSAAMGGLLALLVAGPALAASAPASLAESARRQAERLALANKPGEALQVLRSARVHATPGDTLYWQFYGDQAWDRGLKPEALMAYRTAWAAGPVHAQAMERLIQHYNESGEPMQAIAIGRQAYQRLGEARWLLLAMDAASQASLWDELRALSRQAKADEGKFSRSEMYWLLQAHVANHDADKPQARAAYDRALALNPLSVATRAQVLWFEIDKGDPQRLASHLANWQDDARTQPAFWAAYAVGLLQLGRVDESLAWFDRQVAEKPDDYLWQLSYVSLLSSSARPEQQARARQDLLGRLRGRLGMADALPRAEAKTLLLAHAALVRDFDGLAAGDQALSDMLARGYNDADVYESLVASSLAQKQFHAAHHWLLRAEADGQKLPAYQSLAVAMGENDTPAIERVLDERAQELSAPDRVTGLRQIGRNQLALSLTEQSLLQAQDNSTELLRQHRDQLRRQLGRWVEAGHESRNLSDLKIRRSEVAASFGHDRGRATLRMAHNALRADGPNLRLTDQKSENDLSLLAEVTFRNDPMRFTLGTNQRADKSLTYGRFEWRHALSGRLSTRLEVLLNGLTEETSALRAIGSKDKVSVGLGGNLTDQAYGRLELAAQHFNTRQGDSLGRGHRLEGELGTAVSSRWPGWQARISGSTEKNQIAGSLPAYLLGPVLPAGQTVEGVLSPRFSTLGIGTTLRFGPPEGGERRVHGLVDAWVGKQWPASERAYSLRAALSLPVASAGQIRAEAFYTNVQGGVSSQANRGMGVWYRHEF
ncbi:MAG: hypothetical protein JWP93_146 [Polaromonas sp.]|nr:hypothetical protein [Polaromonas sp.]